MKTETEVRRKIEELRKLHRDLEQDHGIAYIGVGVGRLQMLQWVLGEPEEIQDLVEAGLTTLSREKLLEGDCANLREEVELLRQCKFFGRDYSHEGCRHAEAPKGAVLGPGLHWSTNLDDALSDHGNYGGYLLREDTHYVVVEEFDDEIASEPALRLRTLDQYKELDSKGWSEVASS